MVPIGFRLLDGLICFDCFKSVVFHVRRVTCAFVYVSFWQFDKLTLVWGKPRQPPLGSEEVRAAFFKFSV